MLPGGLRRNSFASLVIAVVVLALGGTIAAITVDDATGAVRRQGSEQSARPTGALRAVSEAAGPLTSLAASGNEITSTPLVPRAVRVEGPFAQVRDRRDATFEPAIACSGNPNVSIVQNFKVDGEPTRAAVTLPAGSARGLVVIAHGYGGWIRREPATFSNPFTTYLARRLGAIVVIPEFRGTIPPPSGRGLSRGMPVTKGAADLIAIAQAYDSACPGLATRAMLAESMGTLMSTVAFSQGPRRLAGGPLFDAWVINSGVHDAVVLGGAVNAVGATGADPYLSGLAADAETEAGGRVVDRPTAYASWSAALQVGTLAARSGLRQVDVVHAIGDWVPVAGAAATALGLAGAGVPSRLALETTDQAATCDQSIPFPSAGDTLASLIGAVPRGVVAGHSGDSVLCRSIDLLAQWFEELTPRCDLSVLTEARHARERRASADVCVG